MLGSISSDSPYPGRRYGEKQNKTIVKEKCYGRKKRTGNSTGVA